jgi:hypothetical protein
MDFPKINACIVCESARPELNNKYVLLGFFGITPHVRMLIQDFSQPVTICFVFSGGPGTGGKYDVSLRLVDPAGIAVSDNNTVPSIKGGVLGANRNNINVFMGFYGLLGEPGQYTVTLLINNVAHYSTTLGIDRAPVEGVLR